MTKVIKHMPGVSYEDKHFHTFKDVELTLGEGVGGFPDFGVATCDVCGNVLIVWEDGKGNQVVRVASSAEKALFWKIKEMRILDDKRNSIG